LIRWPKHGGANQRFTFKRSGNVYSFVAVNSGKAFGAWGNEDKIAQSGLSGNSDQLFLLEQAQ